MSELEPARQAPRRGKVRGFALLAGMVIAVPVISILLRPDTVREPPPDAPRLTAPPNTSANVYSVDFADEQHGFALRLRSCDDRGCRHQLLVTEDGEEWKVRDLPYDARTLGNLLTLSALGRCTVANDAVSPDPGMDVLWFSNDCGTTWRRVPQQIAGTVRSIPAGSTLTAVCRILGPAPDGCARVVAVTMPETGRRMRLATAPALDALRVERTPFADGAWWISGRNPDNGRWSVAVSRDDGRTWDLRTLQALSGGDVARVRMAGQGVNIYAVAEGGPEHEFGLVAIFHSDDRGKTWEQTWRTGGSREPERLRGTALARPDDLLIMEEEGIDQDGKGWHSFDHGRTFLPASPAEFLGSVFRTRGGYVLSTGLGSRWYRSPDGVRWQEIRFPTSP